MSAMVMGPPVLTARELEVLSLVALGLTHLQIAERLGISAHTVTSHLKSAYRKLDVHTAAAAVFRAVCLRLLCKRHDRQCTDE